MQTLPGHQLRGVSHLHASAGLWPFNSAAAGHHLRAPALTSAVLEVSETFWFLLTTMWQNIRVKHAFICLEKVPGGLEPMLWCVGSSGLKPCFVWSQQSASASDCSGPSGLSFWWIINYKDVSVVHILGTLRVSHKETVSSCVWLIIQVHMGDKNHSSQTPQKVITLSYHLSYIYWGHITYFNPSEDACLHSRG